MCTCICSNYSMLQACVLISTDTRIVCAHTHATHAPRCVPVLGNTFRISENAHHHHRCHHHSVAPHPTKSARLDNIIIIILIIIVQSKCQTSGCMYSANTHARPNTHDAHVSVCTEANVCVCFVVLVGRAACVVRENVECVRLLFETVRRRII